MKPEKIKDLEKQGYRIAGSHSAIKVCEWTKKAIRGEDVCYKNKFYGIKSWRCIQMTCALNVCTHRCVFCWRDITFTLPKWTNDIDEPSKIVDDCIKKHIRYLQGFKGNPKTKKNRFEEALKPLHFAISLSGEPTFYPKLPGLIKEINKRNMTSFLVTNGTNPKMLKELLKDKVQPTQLYITLPAPNKEIYLKVCSPLIKDSWEKIIKSLDLMKRFNCRKAIRLTLTKNENMLFPEQYAELLKNIDADFFEIKAYVWVGYSRQRLEIENMPRHYEIKEFARKLASLADLKIIDEKKESRVVLLMREDFPARIMKF